MWKKRWGFSPITRAASNPVGNLWTSMEGMIVTYVKRV